MKEFKYLSYSTIYSCEGDLNKQMNSEACFGYVFNNIKRGMNVKYVIRMYKGVSEAKQKHISNACLFTIAEVRKHIVLLKRLYPLKYEVSDKGDSFYVTLCINDVPSSFHKYALTWVRYMYEYPYNVLLKDAYRLKKDPTFRFYSIANLFNLCIGCYCDRPRDIHQIPLNCVSADLTISDVREKLKKVYFLHHIYKKIQEKRKVIPDEILGHTNEDIEYWEEGFEVRKEIYMNVYNDKIKLQK